MPCMKIEGAIMSLFELMQARFELGVQIMAKIWPFYAALGIGAVVSLFFGKKK